MERTARRLAELRKKMVETGTDLVALGPGKPTQWVLGFHTYPDERPAILLISRLSEAFLMPALNAEDSRGQTSVRLFPWEDAEGPDQSLADALEFIGARGARKVAIDETMRADFALLVLDSLPGVAHEFTLPTVGALRMRKDRAEYDILKENARINDRAMQAGMAALRPGITEREVADVIRAQFTQEGAKPLFWIVASGANGAFPHHHTSDRVIGPGDAVVVDIGGQKGEFPSDMTRMAVVGDAPEGYQEVHGVVEAAVQAALSAAKPGARACDVDRAARDVISKAGYGDFFVHRTGHGLGLDVHEPPFITATSQVLLDEGMVFSIEPGIYLPDRFGIRLEEIVYLRADGPEILSELPRDLHVAAG